MRTRLSTGRRAIRKLRAVVTTIAAGVVVSSLSGCTAITQPIDGIPASRLPQEFLAEPKNDLVPVDIGVLAIDQPREYELGPGDILGVYIEGVLPFNPPEKVPQPPPINFPDAESPLPPSIGYPIAVMEDGTLSLPLLEPMPVEGLTLEQVRDAIREAYIDAEVLRPEKARPIITIIQERTYSVIVVREGEGGRGGAGAGGGEIARGNDQSIGGGMIKLKAYQNDVLHALMQTGGLPGLGSKNQVKILRADEADRLKREQFLRDFYEQQKAVMLDPCACLPDLPDDPSVLTIPLRVKPGVIPSISDDDVRLQDGDIVYVESRETEVYYTGGLLPGGEQVLPRDYDLDVLGAMALAGQGIYNDIGGGGGGGGRGRGGMGMGLMSSGTRVPPGVLYILRKTSCNEQIAIEVDLAKAMNDPRARPLVQPGDYLILQYKCEEELSNFAIQTFFTFGVAELLGGGRNRF
ncbi:MAG: sugar ABC transporter substrate-binding protein [Planctomycetaceae bacterium]|nr:sugar ABC transporter substrate-binding protein [Planctomycetaceae bacterium]